MLVSPRVSVIIPCLNSAQYLYECLDSVRKQSFPDFEVLICDGGSSDGTIEIAESFCGLDSRFRVIKCEKRGVSAQRNEGINRATGAYISFVDSDDVVSPSYIERLLTVAETQQADISICRYQEFAAGQSLDQFDQREDNTPRKELFQNALEGFYENSYSNGYLISCSKLYSREAIGNVRFNEVVSYGEDTDFNFWIFNQKMTIAHINDVLYFYRLHGANVTQRATDKMYTQFWALFEQFDYLVSHNYFSLLRPAYDRIYWNLNYCYLTFYADGMAMNAQVFRGVSTFLKKRKKEKAWLSLSKRVFLSFPKFYAASISRFKRGSHAPA